MSVIKTSTQTESRTEHPINDFITLKLENRKTHIYVKGEEFRLCKHLLFNVHKDDVREFDYIDSIDEMRSNFTYRTSSPVSITPEEEFIGHCSNLQAWVEHNYDTRILAKNIAFPLLKKLSEAGDLKAKRLYKNEIALRFSRNFVPVMTYLVNQNYLADFSDEEAFDLIQNPQFYKLFSQEDKSWFSKLGMLTYFAKRFFSNNKKRDYVLNIIASLWRTIPSPSKSDLLKSNLFPYFFCA